MDRWHELRRRSYEPEFLWKLSLSTLAVGALLGWIASSISAANDREARLVALVHRGLPGSALDVLRELWNDPSVPLERALEAIGSAAAAPPYHVQELGAAGLGVPPSLREIDVRVATEGNARRDEERTLAIEVWRSVQQGGLTSELLGHLDRETALAETHYAEGVVWSHLGEERKAAAAFEAAGQEDDAERAREMAILHYWFANDEDALARLSEDERFRSCIPRGVGNQLLVRQGRWWDLFWRIPSTMAERLDDLPAVGLATVAAVAWWLFAVQAGQCCHAGGGRWWLTVAALGLGVLSIWPTTFLNYYMEHTWHLQPSEELVAGIRFYVVSVGLREELSKLLLLLPLAPFLWRRGNRLEILIVAACVGLGFAFFENIGYFSRSGQTSSMGRFLTANFFHMAATAIVGVHVLTGLPAGLKDGLAGVLNGLAVFLVVVFAHGLYDAGIAVPQLAEFYLLPSLVYIFLAYQFFHELRQLRQPAGPEFSLTATFVIGLSLLASITFVMIATRGGWRAAGDVLVADVTALGGMVYLFLREIPN